MANLLKVSSSPHILTTDSIERIMGTCDLLVKVEAPIRTVFVANKILPKEWVKCLNTLKVEPFRTDECLGLTIDELLSLKRVITVDSTQ